MPLPSGVYSFEGQWLWRCASCDSTAQGPATREESREAYKAHRKVCNSSPTTITKEKPVATTPKKAKAAKKAVKTTSKKKTTAKKTTAKAAGRLWRFGFLKSAKGRDVTPRVGKNGKLSTRAAKRLGVKQAPKWGRIRSTSRQAALTALKAGKGEWFTPKKLETD